MTTADRSHLAFCRGDSIYLRPLMPEDAGDSYWSWLNDPELLRFRGPKAFPSGFERVTGYIQSIPQRGDLVLAICLAADHRHVGNVTLNSIAWGHRSAELSILLGDKTVWGRGIAKQAMALITAHGFRNMGLNRIWAESPNPAFNGAVRSLGWSKEGVKRQAFLLDGAFVDFECWSMLAAEFFAGEARP